jgi:pimeloyl-ACP methyl ester carboxylesterase
MTKQYTIGRTVTALSAALITWCATVEAAAADRLPVASVTASADDGNLPANTVDGSLSTRWSANGDGQWILYDLGSNYQVQSLSAAWYQGNKRKASFDVQTSAEGTTWTTVFSSSSSGRTLGLESYNVTDSSGRFVRVVGHGNSASTWNSITEVQIFGSADAPPPPPPPPPTEEGALTISDVAASSDDGNVPENSIDGSLTTRWSAEGNGEWIAYDLGASKTVATMDIAWHKGDQRQALFEVQTSSTGGSWNTVFAGTSSGATLALERYNLTDSSGQYVRIVGHGNSSTLWNSITEVRIYGTGGTNPPPPPPPPPQNVAPTVSVTSPANGASYTAPANINVNVSAADSDGSVTKVELLVGGNVLGTDTSAPYTLSWNNVPAGNYTVSARATDNAGATKVSTGIAISVKAPTNAPALPVIKKTFTTLQIGNGKMPYWRNRPIDAQDPRVTRAIIVLHGSGANAEGYFDRINDIIPSSWGDKVMVIAPHFKDPSEAGSGEYWWDGDWREGGESGGISSYTVVDTIIGLLRNGNFPNLKWVVICGHSAGGQFTQRYAAFANIDTDLVKFVPANPSSYVYLNEYRYGGNNNWIIPAECSSGDGYNEWKYGLTGLYGYTAARGAEFARIHLPQREVELLAGDEDVVVDSGLDTDCGAMRQGEVRYERAQNFNAFMDHFYPNNNFSITTVPGVGHDSTLMFASPQGMQAIFFAD